MECQGDFVRGDADAVIHYAYGFNSTGPDLDNDLGSTGVDGVFQQLLDHRRRPLHHLTGGDPGCQV